MFCVEVFLRYKTKYISVWRLVNNNFEWKLCDDDRVSTMKQRDVPVVLRNNKYGHAYGIVYNQVS